MLINLKIITLERLNNVTLLCFRCNFIILPLLFF